MRCLCIQVHSVFCWKVYQKSQKDILRIGLSRCRQRNSRGIPVNIDFSCFRILLDRWSNGNAYPSYSVDSLILRRFQWLCTVNSADRLRGDNISRRPHCIASNRLFVSWFWAIRSNESQLRYIIFGETVIFVSYLHECVSQMSLIRDITHRSYISHVWIGNIRILR